MDLERFLEPDGTWCQALGPFPDHRETRRPALFLDRDGVVVEEVHFLHRPEDVVLMADAARVIARARALGIVVVLATNQSGIARGLYGWEAFAATQERITAALEAEGAALDMVLACPFHPDGKAPYGGDHPCRKPRAGMLQRAADRLNLDLGASWVIGDRARDLEAGRAAGCAGGLHVLTGHGRRERVAARALKRDDFDVYLGASIAAAAKLPLLQD
jgi:D-glycero-D-manno-heptose 1,7-bisphosphate phosphatase